MENITQERMRKIISALNSIPSFANLSEEEKEEKVIRLLTPQYMDLRCDWAFKHVFRNLDLLKLLLEDLLPEENILKVEHLPNEMDRVRPDDKNIIMDVLCKTRDGREFIVEMQQKKKQTFKNRMFYYGSSMVYSQLRNNGQSNDYGRLMPVFVICFMAHTLRHETEQLAYRYVMREETSGEKYGKQLTIILCELPRLKKKTTEDLTPMEHWFYILANLINFAGNPEDLGDRYAAVLEAARIIHLPEHELLNYMNAMVSEEEKQDIGAAYYEDGHEDGLKEGLRIGEERGLKKGLEQKAEAIKEIARNLVSKGMSLKVITEVTGLSEEELQELV